MAIHGREVRLPRSAAGDHHRHWVQLLDASDDRGIGAALPVRSWIFDALVALVFVGVGSVFLPVFFPAAGTVDFVFVGLVNLPLVLRRRLPKIAFALVLVAGLAQILTPRPIGIHDATLLFALYSVAGYSNRRVGLFALTATVLVAVVGSATDWWGYINDQLTGGRPTALTLTLTLLGMIVLVLVSWASGERLRSARIGLAALAERAATLERERSQQAQLAAAAERARIAREMHDVIAHALSVMIAQADGAGYVIDESPATAKTALERISRAGRDSLTQMRALLGLLREGASGEAKLGPQPGLDQLSDLIEEGRADGLSISVTERGGRRPAPAMIGLTVYRVVQEALSNARKHGGEAVDVRLDFRRDGIELVVANGVAGPGRDLPSGPPGHGLTGMAERLSAIGGTLRTGATPDGFLITAWMPYGRGMELGPGAAG